ncbi:DUF2304 domain-containing protein [Ruania alba]|uniref:DUF2304 domain-containing protein n=1 Tax=Ruania alba TaxID=648782 RepID=A0A1H5N8S9_9MICO|nr:DUF2304 domain-containing protein [Ruania alba]SEE98042.1 hypothetical protein SAMN04488554_4079 [Ruania alba]
MPEQIVIQVVLLVGITVVTALLTRSTADARHQAIRRVLLVAFVLVTATTIVFPTVLSRLAALVGVGRGTDLLLYGLLIAFLSFIATNYRRMKQLDRRITELTRTIALTQVRQERAGLPTADTPGTAPEGTPDAPPDEDPDDR